MTPIEAMELAFEASGCDGSLGVEGRILAGLHHLGFSLVEQAHEHRWVDPDKTETFCGDCGDVRKDERDWYEEGRRWMRDEGPIPSVLTLRSDRPLYPSDPELARLRALQLTIVEYLASNGSDGLYDAGRMISARNTLYLLLDRPGDIDVTHPAFTPAADAEHFLEAVGVIMARVAGLL